MPAEQRGSVYKTARGYGIAGETDGRDTKRASRRGPRRAWFRDVEQKRMRGGPLMCPR
jgi:hypothetical protein